MWQTVSFCQGVRGEAGPPGPIGPPGPTGPAGALNRIDATGVLDASGSFTLTLPTASIANGKLPAIACYMSEIGQTWLAIAYTPTSSGSPFCGITGIGSPTPGLRIVNGFTGWRFYLIAIW
jgi:hypothetical protein